MGLRAAFSGVSFLSGVLLARLLGPSGLGAYSYSLAWMVLLAVPALLGMDQFLVREIARNVAAGEWGVVRGLLRWSSTTVLWLSCGLAALAAAGLLLLVPPSHSDIRVTFMAALPFLPLICLTRVRQAIMQGLHRASLGALPEQLIQPALLLAFLVVAEARHLRITAVHAMIANIAGAALAFAAGAAMMRRALPRQVSEFSPICYGRKWLGGALPLVFVTAVGVVFGQADTLILGAFKGDSAVGIYSIAHKGSELIGLVLMAQITAFASTTADLYSRGDTLRLQRMITRLARVTFLLSAPAVIVMAGFGRYYLMLYGRAFAGAKLTLAILSIGQAMNVAAGGVGMLLVMTGHERRVARAIGAGAVANVLLSCALAPRWGAEGVAVSYAASMVFWNVLAVFDLYRLTGLDSTIVGLGFRRAPAHAAVSASTSSGA